MPLFETARHRRARELRAAGFRPEWRDLVDGRVPHLRLLDADERRRLEARAVDLLAGPRWEAAHGFELTDEIVVTIAAQAALLALELAPDAYRNVGTVLVHPTTITVEGARVVAPGLATDAPMAILGQAHLDGPVVIVWDAAREDARHPERGHNVVLHEFAHKLDMLGGSADGTPPMATREELDRWIEVCTEVYDRISHGVPDGVLRAYAGVNPAEFFAVATEAFFDVPVRLRDREPALYEVLRAFYRQDPAARVARGQADSAP